MACNFPYILIRSEPHFHVLPVPCGYCASCRRDKITMWQDRIAFESLTSPNPSSFLTLTYDEAHIPPDRSANLRHTQLFFKNLRYFSGQKFRYFLTSEYGDEHYRVHYHICLTNFDANSEDNYLAVMRAWSDKNHFQKGIFTLDPLNPARIRYCIEYMSYENPNMIKAYQAIGLKPPIHTMSKGIGAKWIEEHADMIKESNGYYSNGILRPLPRYYKDKLGMIEVNKYFETLDEMWKPYNDLLVSRGMEPVNPLDVNGIKKRGLLDHASCASKRTVLQLAIGKEGKELAVIGKSLHKLNAVSKY